MFFTPPLVALLPTPAPPPIGATHQGGLRECFFLKEEGVAEQQDVCCSLEVELSSLTPKAACKMLGEHCFSPVL